MPGLALVSTKCADSAAAGAWRDALLEIVGALGGSLWRLLDAAPSGGPGPGHTHVAWVEGHDPVGAYRTAVADARADGRLPIGHADVRIDHWLGHGERCEIHTGAVAEGRIVAEVLCTDPAREAEWDRWYDEQHLPDMMATGAFTTGSRWVRHPRRGVGCDHLTVYDIADTDAATAVAVSAAAMPALVAAGRKHECHTGGRTMALDAE